MLQLTYCTVEVHRVEQPLLSGQCGTNNLPSVRMRERVTVVTCLSVTLCVTFFILEKAPFSGFKLNISTIR